MATGIKGYWVTNKEWIFGNFLGGILEWIEYILE